MEKKVYIRGNAEHPEKVMEALEKHGCENPCNVVPLHRDYLYYIAMDGSLDYVSRSNMLYHMLIEYGEELFIEPDYKFKVGDKVKSPMNHCKEGGKITQLINRKGEPWYRLEYIGIVPESELEPHTEKPQDITERIKTFEDACKWCTENGHHNIRREYDCIVTDTLILDEVSPDLIAYLKLRIITCALNEGWEPKYTGEDEMYHIYCDLYDNSLRIGMTYRTISAPYLTIFKSRELAEYAASQFNDIYIDLCKGKE